MSLTFRGGRPRIVRALLQALEEIAPLYRAGSWDNVGLLIDTTLTKEPEEFTVFVTNDLTEKVMMEALTQQANFIVTYHPSPFRSFKKITRADPISRLVMSCISNNIGVYAPHTALDNAPGGINDWLLDAVGGQESGKICAATWNGTEEPSSFPQEGDGRYIQLHQPQSLLSVIEQYKKHLNLEHVRVAIAMDALWNEKADKQSVTSAAKNHMIQSIAVCAGSGSSVLNASKMPRADVWITGEMSHHEILAANVAGTTVLLTDHSNTERGYLPVLADKIDALTRNKLVSMNTQEDSQTSLPKLNVVVTNVDADPLVVM